MQVMTSQSAAFDLTRQVSSIQSRMADFSQQAAELKKAKVQVKEDVEESATNPINDSFLIQMKIFARQEFADGEQVKILNQKLDDLQGQFVSVQ